MRFSRRMPAICGIDPTPGVPADNGFGRALAQATRSSRLLAGMLVRATSRNALLGNSATGSRSFNTSYLRLNTAPLITWVDVLPILTV